MYPVHLSDLINKILIQWFARTVAVVCEGGVSPWDDGVALQITCWQGHSPARVYVGFYSEFFSSVLILLTVLYLID